MNLLRRAHPGAGLTTAVVLLCGIVSGAALAAGDPAKAQPTASTIGTVPTPGQPRVAQIPSIPGVPAPSTRAPGMATRLPTIPSGQGLTKVATPAPDPFGQDYDDDALVLRAPTAYEQRLLAKQANANGAAPVTQAAQSAPVAPVEQAETPIATAQPFSGLNLNGLGFFLFALLAVAGFLAYRKKQIQANGVTDLTLEVASSIRVGNRWQVCLVRVPGRMLVLGATDKGLELLTELYPDGDEDAMGELLSTASMFQAEAPMTRRPATAHVAPTPEPEPTREPSTVDVFDGLTDITPRHDDHGGAGAYRRPVRRQTTAPGVRGADLPTHGMDRSSALPPLRNEAAQTQLPGHDDAFLDAVLERLTKARPAVVRHATTPAPQVDERAALRAQVKQYRRGPTRL